MKKINILVTGAASGVGQSIIRSLKKSKLKSKINVFISDILDINPYPIYNFSYIKIPKVEQKNSKNKIKNILIFFLLDLNMRSIFFQNIRIFLKKLVNLKFV